ncbi:MAG: molybdopterin-dependent oxidoreductase [Nitrospira sp.]|nr:4Fe-4S dicluster domain-containing protein [Candidatus Manganitrophaceae bacterium]HIL35113.1 4Fe-4S dicluster domain-containing protein [Candidatus Manganitrophaceae bacterium]
MSEETKKIELPKGPEGDGNVTTEEKEMVELSVDGIKTVVEKNSSLYTAIKDIGIKLPAMCYHYSFSPFGSCGLCLVEVEGKKNKVRSCTAKASDGMVIATDTEKMIEARKKAVEKHLVTHPLDCPVCDADGKCELQDMAYDLDVYDIKKGKRKEIPEDTRSVVLDFNMERCILCGQCINVCKEVQLVDRLCFYKKDKKTHVGAHGGVPLDCEFCGDCLAVCPVGAIVSRFSKYAFKPWQLKKTETTCSYCSDGCTLILESQDQKIVRVTSELSYRSKFGEGVGPEEGHGGICVRGRFGFEYVQSENRLSRPLVKKDGKHTEIPWFTAMIQIGKRLSSIKEEHGGQAIAGLISGRCTNEEVYLFQRLMRSVLGTNNIDTAARYGHMNSVLAMKHALGIGGSTTTYDKITVSDVILLVGSNMTETNPIAALRVKKAMAQFDSKVIVADTSQTDMMGFSSTHPLQINLYSEGAFIQGLVKAVIDQGLVHSPFAEKYAPALEVLQKAVSSLSTSDIEASTGLSWDKISEAARLLATSKRGTLIWGEGVISKEGGYENVLRLTDLAMITGLLEKEGAGIHPICEENNEQGAVDMGGVPEFLPGQVPYSSASARQLFSSEWHASLPDPIEGRVGLTLPEIIEAAHRGEIKALYIVGENPVGSLPASMKVREALEKIDLVICQDPFLTETGEGSDYVLPAITFAEKDGTFTNMAGEVNRVSQAFEPCGEARSDLKIFSELSRHLGQWLQYGGPEDVRQEISKRVPGYYSGEKPPIQFDTYLKNNFLSEVTERYETPASTTLATNKTAPFLLSREQVLYHSGKLSTQDKGLLKIDDKSALQIGETDAENLQVKTGDLLLVKSALGSVEVPVEIVSFLPSGLIQFPEHFNRFPIKDLLPAVIDPVSHVPYLKKGAVSLEKVTRFDLKVITPKPELPQPSPESP